MTRAFAALYRGKCSDCGEWWKPGDPIRYSLGADGNFVHADCDAAEPTEKPEGAVCPTCFLRRSLSGECGCDA